MPVAGGLCHPECTSGRAHLLTFSRYGGPMLRVLTLATLFPDATRPTFGVFVERQTLGLAAPAGEIGRAHVRTPVTNAHLVCRPLLDQTDSTLTTGRTHI